MGERLFRRRIDYVLTTAAIAAEPFAINEKFEIGVHDVLTVLLGTLVCGLATGPALACRD
jgi:hypothetical protein